jgi:hypothetical protein
MKKPAKEAGLVVVPSLLHFVLQGKAGLELELF